MHNPLSCPPFAVAGDTALPRLRVLPTVLFSLVVVLFLALTATAAYPAGIEQTGSALALVSNLSMLFLAAPALCCGAFLGCFGHPLVLPILVPLTGVLAFFVTGEAAETLLCLAFFVPIYLLRAMLAAGTPRTGAICRLSASCAVIGVGFFLLSLGRFWGEISFDAVGRLIEVLFAELTEMLRSMQSTIEGSVPDTYTRLSQEQAAAIAELVLSMLPAMLVLFFNIMAWIGQGGALLLFRVHGLAGLLPIEAKQLTMSLPAAVVFLAAVVGSVVFTFDKSTYIAEVVANNLFTIFEPPFALIGLGVIADFFRRYSPTGTTMLALVLVSLFCCSSSLFLLVLAFLGFGRTLRRFRRAHPAA